MVFSERVVFPEIALGDLIEGLLVFSEGARTALLADWVAVAGATAFCTLKDLLDCVRGGEFPYAWFSSANILCLLALKEGGMANWLDLAEKSLIADCTFDSAGFEGFGDIRVVGCGGDRSSWLSFGLRFTTTGSAIGCISELPEAESVP